MVHKNMNIMKTFRVEIYRMDPLEHIDTIFCDTKEEAVELSHLRTDKIYGATPIIDIDGATEIISTDYNPDKTDQLKVK